MAQPRLTADDQVLLVEIFETEHRHKGEQPFIEIHHAVHDEPVTLKIACHKMAIAQDEIKRRQKQGTSGANKQLDDLVNKIAGHDCTLLSHKLGVIPLSAIVLAEDIIDG